MTDIINFYETEAVKKYLPDKNDPQKEFTGMNIDTRILLCGSSGSGKSNALLNYILLTSQPKDGTFKHIFLISKVKEPLYETLEEKLKDKISIFRTLAELPSVQDFKDRNKDKPEHYLVILDDCVTDKDKLSKKKIDDYYAFSRKKGITTIYLSQSYFQTPKFCRDNCEYIILVSIKSVRDLNRIINEYSLPNIELEQIQKMFNYATSNKLNFLKITTGSCPVNEKFSRNYLDYLDPNKFKSSKSGGKIKNENETSSSDSESSSDKPVYKVGKYKTYFKNLKKLID